jgi:hypothetical protein
MNDNSIDKVLWKHLHKRCRSNDVCVLLSNETSIQDNIDVGH